MLTKKKMWEQSLELWRRLASCPSVKRKGARFVETIMPEVENYYAASPMCEYYKSCGYKCPLWIFRFRLLDTPLARWTELADKGYHSQKAAQDFYEYLLELKAKER